MSNSRRITFLAIALLALGILAHHVWFSTKAQIERAVSRAVRALEDEDLAGVQAFFHADFKDGFGLDRESWTSLIQYSWRHWKDVNIRLLQPRIEIQGDRAVMRFHALAEATAAASIGAGQTPRRETATRQNVSLQLKKQDGHWRLTGVGDLTPVEWGITPEMVNQ